MANIFCFSLWMEKQREKQKSIDQYICMLRNSIVFEKPTFYIIIFFLNFLLFVFYMINIVVSRYNKNTDFVKKLEKYNTHIIIYDKENINNPYNVPINKGNEASVYLKYIIDNYYNLSDFTFFIHDEEYSWHHKGSIEERFLEAIHSKELFYNINSYDLHPYSHISEKKELMEWYNTFIQPYIPFEKLPNKDWLSGGYKGCSQFLVHKSLITNLPRRFYEDIYNWMLVFENGKLSGYFLEWTWHLFWVIYPKMCVK